VDGNERQDLMAELQLHQHEVVAITRCLALMDRSAATSGSDPQAIFLKAQITRHRIDLALLAARLQAAA
jgi:hypothetical protein